MFAGHRRLRLRQQTGDLHRPGAVRRHIRRRGRRQRRAGVDILPAQAHEKRAQHIHTQFGTGRSAGDRQQRAVHVHRLHGKSDLSYTPLFNILLFFFFFSVRRNL